MDRLIATLLRGSFRVVLGASVALSAAWALLWLMDAVLGGGIWLFDKVWLGVGLALLVALAGGIAVAIACDRAWLRVRSRGPRLTLKRWYRLVPAERAGVSARPGRPLRFDQAMSVVFEAAAAAVRREDRYNVEYVEFAEHADGSGQTLEIQRALEFDEQDVELGQDTYCLVRDASATCYGGVTAWQFSGGRLTLSLEPAAAQSWARRSSSSRCLRQRSKSWRTRCVGCSSSSGWTRMASRCGVCRRSRALLVCDPRAGASPAPQRSAGTRRAAPCGHSTGDADRASSGVTFRVSTTRGACKGALLDGRERRCSA